MMGRAAVEYPGHGWEMPTLDQMGIIMLLQLKKVEQRGLTRRCCASNHIHISSECHHTFPEIRELLRQMGSGLVVTK